MLIKLDEAPGDFVFEVVTPDGYTPESGPGQPASSSQPAGVAGGGVSLLRLNVIEIGAHMRTEGWTPDPNAEVDGERIALMVKSIKACAEPRALVEKLSDTLLYAKYIQGEVAYIKLGEEHGPSPTSPVSMA